MYYPPPPPPAYPPQYYGPRYSGCLKFFLYALSFFIPIAGIIIGVIYMGKGDPESSGLGKVCLILAIVGLVLLCCAVSVSFLFPFLGALLSSGGY